jgi:hypothetical protein
MSISHTGKKLQYWPDCPNHPGQFVRAVKINGAVWTYCRGTGWHEPLKWWQL